MGHQPIEELDVFILHEQLSTWAWDAVKPWDNFAKRTIGEQMVRAIDSVNANLVEGDGRYSTNDALRFFIIARGSSREARLWIHRATSRGLIEPEQATVALEKLEKAARLLNLFINYRRKTTRTDMVKEISYSLDPNRPVWLESDNERQTDPATK